MVVSTEGSGESADKILARAISKAEDDFFAFGGEDIPAVAPRKKRKRKERRKRQERTLSAEARSNSTGTDSVAVNLDDDSDSLVEVTRDSTESADVSKRTPANDDLFGLLGISEVDQESRKVSKQPRNKPFKVSIDDRDDQFLKQLDAETLMSPQEHDSELEEILERHSRSDQTVMFNGERIKVKHAAFALTVEVPVEEDLSLGFRLRVRSNAKFKTIVQSLLAQLAAHEHELPKEYGPVEDLVFYIEESNLIFSQVLRVGSLLLSGARWPVNEEGDAFEVKAELTSESIARRRKQEDMMLKSLTSEPVDVDDFAEEDEETTLVVVDMGSSKETSVVVRGTTSLQELLSIFLVRMDYPEGLNVEIQHEGLVLGLGDTVDAVGLQNGDRVEMSYSEEQLSELVSTREATADVDGQDDDDFGEVLDQQEAGNAYFSIKLKGKDKREVRVRVQPTTMIRTLAEYYLKKVGLGVGTSVRLIFDDEVLGMDKTVGDTELEEDYLVDVMTSE